MNKQFPKIYYMYIVYTILTILFVMSIKTYIFLIIYCFLSYLKNDLNTFTKLILLWVYLNTTV